MNYIFASGAIGAKSTKLLGETEYLTLLKTDKGDYFKVLRDLGYGFDHVSLYLDEVITNELIKIKSELLAIVPDQAIIRLWYLKYDLVNIKLIIKNHLFNQSNNLSFEKAATININELKEALINNNFDGVSDINQKLLRKLSDLINDSKLNSQMISFKVDQIVYQYVKEEVKKYNDEAFLKYLEGLIDSRNLITLFRAQNITLDTKNLEAALIEGGKVNPKILKDIYNLRFDEQMDVLKLYYSDFVKAALQNYFDDGNLSKLETALNEDILESINNFSYDTFSSGPLINYLLKKDFEINNVRRLYFDKDIEIKDLLIY